MVLNRLRWQFREFPFGDGEAVCVFKTALTFVDSVAEIWAPLLQGRALLVLDKQVTSDTERLVYALEDNRVSRVDEVDAVDDPSMAAWNGNHGHDAGRSLAERSRRRRFQATSGSKKNSSATCYRLLRFYYF